MQGATPPNVYALSPREQLFTRAGIAPDASRRGTVYGARGCSRIPTCWAPTATPTDASLQELSAFLQAYQNGEIKRLAVVARMD